MKDIFRTYGGLARIRDARIMLAGGSLSTLGDAMALVALLLRVHATGAGPYAVTVLLLCFAAPVVLTLGLAGAVADRYDSRRVLLVTGVVQTAAAAALAFAHDLVTICGLVLVLQAGYAFGNPVWGSLQPVVVDEARLPTLVSAMQATRAVAAPTGSALGGVLTQVSGPAAALLGNALTFAVLTVGGVSLRARRHGEAADGRPIGLLPRAGVEALRRAPVAGVLLMALAPFIVTLESVNAVEVFLVRDVLGASPAAFGVSEATAGAAALAGALLAGAVHGRGRQTRWILVALFGIGAAQVLQGLAPAFAVYLVGCFGVGCLLGLVNTLVFTVLLGEVAQESRGAALALLNGAARVGTVLALVLGGVLGTTLGPRGAFVTVGVVGLAVAALAGWRLRRVRSPERTRHTVCSG